MGGPGTNPAPIFVDTNAIIESIRTRCWPAITGQHRVATVTECRDEALRGSDADIPGYIAVSGRDLSRLSAVHPVDQPLRAALKLAYADADGLDPGEQDLLAYVHHLGMEHAWQLCSPDRAAMRAVVKLGFGDRLVSLERLAVTVGARPDPTLRRQYEQTWLQGFRTELRMEDL